MNINQDVIFLLKDALKLEEKAFRTLKDIYRDFNEYLENYSTRVWM
ncbi:hypothetical protein CNO14_07145 (plasmid) [Borrelia miyamotoi]|uniref:Uncharacterized protein n=2 Tax=Borrelia miyamotoi TaxID=47466 RepID=A0AAQ3CLZ7_9SPIR|nr:hypothetical protein [Borrelia miyamotoi]AHH05830.1 hypothetical protein BOM_1287 [Borrelia miyamotoi FR64b]WAZ71061.1 hypothetical protein O5403_05200 [Borrelia miyamotoi]WCB91040.1 hypothetical protein CNO11_07280 [Borrelia miyamotoi]WCL22172.1 hypothetical protein CNO10_07330 [Borrelia miyamotoi]WDE70431.1 hypothetical protein CNO12_07485 [Borrelia miyamotoi]